MKNTFTVPIIPADDQQRIKSLHSYQLLDTPFEETFDNITELIRSIFDTPIALISLVDAERVWFKSNTGMEGHRETSRGVSLCALAVLNEDVTVFEDALKEPCLLKNPLVVGSFGLKFYAGAPLTSKEGHNIGAVCIVDKTPRSFTTKERDSLKRIAKIVMDKIEMRKTIINAKSA
ncbi:MAG: GAF domain-containing protein [Bacteroidota bacterium]